MNAIKQQILATGRLSADELDKKISEKISTGKALNEQGALNLLKSEMAEQKVDSGVEEVGYLLGTHVNEKKKTKRVFLLKDDYTTRSILLHPKTQSEKLRAPCAVKISGCDRIKNIFTGYEYLVSTENSKIAATTMKLSFVDCCPPLSTVTRNGVVALRGRISQVWPDRDWTKRKDKNQPVSELPELPILDKDGQRVHLGLVIGDREKSVRVSIPSADHLKMLLEKDDLGFVYKQNGKELLVNALRNMDIIVFGRMSDENSDGRKVNPYMNLWPFGWVLQQKETPVREPSAAAADADEDAEI